MKNRIAMVAAPLLALFLVFNSELSTAFGQGTAFTYQGQLQNNGSPASGLYDLRFAVFDASAGGNQAGSSVTNFATGVSNGLFIVTLNFGGIFTGTNYWLEIGARTNGTSSFTVLMPRQAITPAPYAIFANGASNLLGTLSSAQLNGTIPGSQVSGAAGAATNFTGSLSGDVIGTQSATVVSLVGGQTAVNIASGVSAANAATSADVANAIMKRDGNGDFVTESVALDNTEIRGSGSGAYTTRDYLLRADNSKGNFYLGDNPPRATFANGTGNTGVGSGAAFNDTSGSGNTAVGYSALDNTINANDNTAVGAYAMQANKVGHSNTAHGYQALNLDISDDNEADGYQALYSNTTGYANVANGFQALYYNDSGIFNTANGAGAMTENTNGSDNVADGYEALFFSTSGNANTAVGFGALYYSTTASGNVANGFEASFANTTGSNNVANGFEALYSNTVGYDDTANGYQALFNNTSGYYNTANGYQALYSNTDGVWNTASGFQALYSNTTGDYNTAEGFWAMYHNITGGDNAAFGQQALTANVSGSQNTAMGVWALQMNLTGGGNTATGTAALLSNTNGNGNTAVGGSAMYYNLTGSVNTAVGAEALQNSLGGSDNIAIGYQAGNMVIGSSNIEIGNVGAPADTNVIRIGTAQNKTFLAGISGVTASGGAAVFVNSSGQLGTITSSARFKKNIRSMSGASDALLSLRPVTFQYKPEIDPQGIPQFGLVAEEVAKVDPDLVLRDERGRPYTVRYEAVNAMLLNEFLKEHQQVENQSAEIQDLKEQNELLGKKLDELTHAVNSLTKSE